MTTLACSFSGLKTGTSQAKGQMPQAADPLNSVVEEAQTQAELTGVLKSDNRTVQCFRRRVPGPQGELQPGPQRPSDSDHGLELVALAVLRFLEAGGSESRARLPRPSRPARAARRDRRPRPCEAPRRASWRRGRGAHDSGAAE
ncbi:hypothetical protein MC885_003749 [Smutsia gigantea]|nr:hypothetical protein MC885_003749 [Smutsia gigantea]